MFSRVYKIQEYLFLIGFHILQHYLTLAWRLLYRHNKGLNYTYNKNNKHHSMQENISQLQYI